MHIGKLRHRLDIQNCATSSGETQDTFGEPIRTWTTSETVWASVEPLTGRERFQAQQVQPEVTHKVKMRYNTSVNAKSRLLYGSRVLQVEAVMNPEERNAEFEILCKEDTT